MAIIIKHLSYIHPNRELLFQNINFSLLPGQKASLIGNNGSGKSTLFKILSRQLSPASGEIIYSDVPYYIPQHVGQYNHQTIAEALNVDKKIEALHNILEGDTSEINFSILNDEWDIEEKTQSALEFWEMGSFPLNQPLASLSGGEKTKVFLSGILLYSPRIILMDEPTNHLDIANREKFYQFIQATNASLLVISHDRMLLNLLSPTYELHKESISIYGGNYDFYKKEKERKLEALQNQLSEKEKELKKVKKIARDTLERQQKHDVRGEKQNQKKGIPRIMMGNLKSQAEKSSSKLKDIHSDKIGGVMQDVNEIRKNIPLLNNLKLNIESTLLHEGKILVDVKGINFRYTDNLLWDNNLDFQIRSSDRWLIQGNNGSGKTTLIKLVTGQLSPASGSILKNDFSYLYIDQDYSIINNNLSVYEQALLYNSGNLKEHEIKTTLNRFLFPKDTWDKRNVNLSGGEKMRLLLCCLQIDNNTPDMIILDEPTNNLDIQSLEVLTTAIQSYKGTIILISHDESFVKEININKKLRLT